MFPDILKGEIWLKEMLEGNPERLRWMTRFTRNQFLHLERWLVSHTKFASTDTISSGQRLLIFLYICAHGATFRQIAEHTNHSLATISRIFNEALLAMCYLHREFVVLPKHDSVPDGIMLKPKLAPYFADCYGAVDGCLIAAWIKEGDHGVWRSRKGTLSQNVMAAMDFEERFTYVLPGWEGSAHDSRVMSDAIERGFKAESSTLSGSKRRYYLADGGYTPFGGLLLPPYTKVRYHLKEWIQAAKSVDFEAENRPANRKELFNLRHAMARNVVERGFGQWKSQWRILDAKEQNFSIQSQKMIIFATTALHNWLKWFKGKFDIGYDESIASANDDNIDLSDGDEVDYGERSSLVDDGIFVRSDTADAIMLKRRDAIAEQMWVDYQAYISLLDF
jgi:hypothetical protein